MWFFESMAVYLFPAFIGLRSRMPPCKTPAEDSMFEELQRENKVRGSSRGSVPLTVHSAPEARSVQARAAHTRARYLYRIRGTPSTLPLPNARTERPETNVTASQPHQPRHRRVLWPLCPAADTAGCQVRGPQRTPVLSTRVRLSPTPRCNVRIYMYLEGASKNKRERARS